MRIPFVTTTFHLMRSRVRYCALLAALALLLGGPGLLHAQQAKPASPTATPAASPAEAKPAPPDPPLYDQEAFDVIVLDEANGNARLKVMPLPLPGRRVPNWGPTTKFTIRLLDNVDEEYEVLGRNIRDIDLYEEMLIAEGRRLIDAARTQPPPVQSRSLEQAFHHFYRVQQSDPNFPGLKDSINQYLFADARCLNALGQYPQAIAVLDELYAREPAFRTPSSATLKDVISALLDRILRQNFETSDYVTMRTLMNNASQRYGEGQLATVARWREELQKLAAVRRDESRRLLEAQKYRESFGVMKQVLEIWPDVEGADVLQADLFGAYPMIFVGVTQPALEHDEQRLDNWGTRRTGRLLHRTLVEFLGAGPEGGQYQLPLGSIDRSEDNRQMVLRLSNSATRRVTGYDVSQRLLELASPATPDYQPAWASLLDQIAVKDVFGVEIGLKRPHVLPEALLRVPLQRRDAAPDAEGSGEFRVQARLARELQFAHKSFRTGGRLAELVELTFDGSDEGLSALRRREIDVLDRVFPADALRVREESAADSPIRIEPYALPTVHVLVPNTQNPFLANRNFRRAILLGIDRETILRQELMGGRNYPGFQVISGPFPASAGESDPLGYAYDESTRPLPYYPLLAKVLTIAFTKEVADTAAKRGDPAPQLKPLRLGYPGYELARVACQAIAAQLQLIGLQVELNEFPLGVSDDTGQECDLVYKDIALWEPVTDARRILGPEGVAPTESPYVQQSLRWLEEAENWGEARERLVDIHRAVYNDVAVLPLWQTVDFLAYHRRIQNVGPNPVWLYQNVDQWRISSEAGAE